MEPVRGVRGIIATEIVVSTQLDPFLSVRALTAYSSLSVRTLRSYIADPVRPLPCYKVGAKILVRRSEFDAWMEEFRQDSTPKMDELMRKIRQVRDAVQSTFSPGEPGQRRP